MVIILTITVIGIPIFLVFANLVGLAFWILSPVFAKIENRLLRFLGRFAFLAISITASIPISMALQPLLSDLRTAGDGGVGMAHNALSAAILYAAVPCAIMLVTGYGLLLTFTKQSQPRPDQDGCPLWPCLQVSHPTWTGADN